MYVSPVLMDYLELHPGMSAEVLMVDRVVNLVEEGFDIAVRIGPLPWSGLAAVRAGHGREVVCGAPGYLPTGNVSAIRRNSPLIASSWLQIGKGSGC